MWSENDIQRLLAYLLLRGSSFFDFELFRLLSAPLNAFLFLKQTIASSLSQACLSLSSESFYSSMPAPSSVNFLAGFSSLESAVIPLAVILRRPLLFPILHPQLLDTFSFSLRSRAFASSLARFLACFCKVTIFFLAGIFCDEWWFCGKLEWEFSDTVKWKYCSTTWNKWNRVDYLHDKCCRKISIDLRDR